MKFKIVERIQTVFWTDMKFWNENRLEIFKWLRENNFKIHSKDFGFFEYSDHDQLVLFLLRWS